MGVQQWVQQSPWSTYKQANEIQNRSSRNIETYRVFSREDLTVNYCCYCCSHPAEGCWDGEGGGGPVCRPLKFCRACLHDRVRDVRKDKPLDLIIDLAADGEGTIIATCISRHAPARPLIKDAYQTDHHPGLQEVVHHLQSSLRRKLIQFNIQLQRPDRHRALFSKAQCHCWT